MTDHTRVDSEANKKNCQQERNTMSDLFSPRAQRRFTRQLLEDDSGAATAEYAVATMANDGELERKSNQSTKRAFSVRSMSHGDIQGTACATQASGILTLFFRRGSGLSIVTTVHPCVATYATSS